VKDADGGNQSLHCCSAASITGNKAGVTYTATISAAAAAADDQQRHLKHRAGLTVHYAALYRPAFSAQSTVTDSPGISLLMAITDGSPYQQTLNPLLRTDNCSATLSNMKLVHWRLIGGRGVAFSTARRGLGGAYQSLYCCIMVRCFAVLTCALKG